MKHTMIIRQAEVKDIKSIAHFNVLAARETESRELDAAAAVKGVTAVIEDPRKGFYLVADQSGRLIGQLMITDEWSDWNNKYFLWIQSVYVCEDSRNQKIFSKLYHYLIDMVKSRDDVLSVRLYVEKNNRVARRVYESLGMSGTIYDMYEAVIQHPAGAANHR